MRVSFGELLRQKRIEKGLSQQQLADRLYVERSSIASWETGRSLPNALMISQLSAQLGTDMAELMVASKRYDESPRVILLDDEKIILNGCILVLSEAMPGADISGFTVPSKAVAFAREHPVDLAFLDIEMGRVSGLDICRQLLDINPRTNVIYLTAYRDYSFDAWDTGACGFILKPLSVKKVQRQIGRLRYPVYGLEGNRKKDGSS